MDFPQSSDPGVGGDQSASEPSPAASGAEQTVAPFSTPEAPGSQPQDMVPRGQLERITAKLKGAEAKLTEYQSQAAQPTRPGFNEELEKLNREARKAFDSDPDRAIDLLGQAADLRASARVNDALENFTTQQAQESQRAQFQHATEASWVQAMKDYPELGNQESDLYKSAYEIWSGDPVKDIDPASMYKAAALANERRMRSGRAAPPALEGGVAPTNMVEAKTDSYSDFKQQTLDKMRVKGGAKGLAEQISPIFEDLLTKSDWHRGTSG